MWKGSRLKKAPVRKKATPTRKSARAQSKLSNSKIAHRRNQVRALVGALVFILIVCSTGGLSWLSFSNFVAVENIAVEGNKEIKASQIQTIMIEETAKPKFMLFSRQNTITYPTKELEDILFFEFPKIESISIDKQPRKKSVVVSIVEREKYAVWCDANRKCYFLDASGFIFEELRATSTEKVIFEGGVKENISSPLRSIVAHEHFVSVVGLLKGLDELNLQVKTFKFEGDDARIIFEAGWELIVALDKDLGATAVNLEAVLDEYSLRDKLGEVLYIDMRFDERVYYKIRE